MKTAAINTQSLKTVQTLLMYTYAVVPIVAGADKFTHLLTDWDKYLNPALADLLPFAPHTFMLVVGVIEIAAGIMVLLRPRIGGYVVTAWLIAIALSLVAGGQYLDVAVRDLVMAIGAFSMAKLTEAVHSNDDFPGLHEPTAQQAFAK
ncbi:hypothetical protein [Pontibacter ruber]|uniref:tRNA (5-methylaminomethyl-2-thiouridylate)-methyltransferase n=1 Tax=Pontibacter ruber TaxID=1343895 RepID=A0ABW5CTC8_9BACT|nr:hypothetical protein [Pontibacter ruber]